MIIKKEKVNNVTVYHLRKNMTDEEADNLKNTFLKPSQIDFIIKDDADVYNEEGELLIRFRKNKLTEKKVKDFYDNVIKFAMNVSTNRGIASGSEKKNLLDNPKIMTNILGYFDKFGPRQKYILKQKNKKVSVTVRETRFTMDYPDKYAKALPLLQEIDYYYKKYIPQNHKKQCKKANETPFTIGGTCFTTITTNVNFQTAVHKDKGDDIEGFGNLVVIEKGKYTGGETCIPQYGVGVDVRTNDILFINVHEWHGNLPIEYDNEETQRLSIVCYLREQIWKKTRGKTKKFMIEHNKTLKKIFKNK